MKQQESQLEVLEVSIVISGKVRGMQSCVFLGGMERSQVFSMT
jgi:hypothetical protein